MQCVNKVLSFEQACEYLGYKKSTLYELVSKKIVPFSKPRKKIYFDRSALENWMLQNVSESLPENPKNN